MKYSVLKIVFVFMVWQFIFWPGIIMASISRDILMFEALFKCNKEVIMKLKELS